MSTMKVSTCQQGQPCQSLPWQRITKEQCKRPSGSEKDGKLLINVDGSFREENGSGGTGVVIRDSNGSFIAGSYTYLEHTVDAPTAEVMALRDGLLLAQHIGYNGFTLQSDCLEVVEAIRMGYSAAAGAPIFYDCFLPWQNFDAISIEQCDREANKVVALSFKDSCTWASK